MTQLVDQKEVVIAGNVYVWRQGYFWIARMDLNDFVLNRPLTRAVIRNVTFMRRANTYLKPGFEDNGLIHGTVVFTGNEKNAFPVEIKSKHVVVYDHGRQEFVIANDPGLIVRHADYVLVESKKDDISGVIVAGWVE